MAAPVMKCLDYCLSYSQVNTKKNKISNAKEKKSYPAFFGSACQPKSHSIRGSSGGFGLRQCLCSPERTFMSGKNCSRCAAPMPVQGAICPGCGTARGARSMWPIILLVGGFLVLGGVVTEYKNPAKPPVQTRLAPPSEDAKGALAVLVRLSGELCARVVGVKSLGGDLYEVDCVRYRDGDGRSTYRVNALTAEVR